MSQLGQKIKEVFGSAAVYKDPANYEIFSGRNLPSFIKDYLISTHVTPDGTLNKARLEAFLNAHIPADNNAVKSRLMQGETLTLLTRFIVSTNLKENKVQFQIPDMGIKAAETEIPFYLVQQFPNDLVDGEKWGILKVVYMPPSEETRGHVELINFKPFRPLENLDLASFRNCRAQFTLDEWIDVLISAMEYNPAFFSNKTEKLEFLTRLLPFVEPNLNMIELAPKGTGKSYVFGQLSKFVWLVSGGKVSRAKLVYDRAQKAPGIMRYYDLVAFDEIQSITFSDPTEIRSFLKGYLEYGKASVDNYEFMSTCGLILLGNIELTGDGYPRHNNYFDELPEVFHESALLDRFHGFIEGWKMPRINEDVALRDWTLNVEFFTEMLHHLRTEAQYINVVNQAMYVPEKADTRHTKAVKRVATAYMKLLFPHVTNVEDLDMDLFDRYCLQPAIRRRDIIRQQCSNIDTEASFAKPMPAYTTKVFHINVAEMQGATIASPAELMEI